MPYYLLLLLFLLLLSFASILLGLFLLYVLSLILNHVAIAESSPPPSVPPYFIFFCCCCIFPFLFFSFLSYTALSFIASSVLHIKDTIGATPSNCALIENANTLARYASICQCNGLVPIVEPEVLMDGDFSIEVAAAATERVLAACYKALSDHHVMLEGTLLKPNMVRSGSDAASPASATEIALATVRVLQHVVPCAVPGITFLSGGMSEEDASMALNHINQAPGPRPWSLTFSYGRALQQSCLKAWLGQDANIPAAQAVLLARAKANGQANLGQYTGGAGGEGANTSTYVKGYVY